MGHRAQTVVFAFEVAAWQGLLGSHDPDREVLDVELVPLVAAIRRLEGNGGWPGIQTPLLAYLRGDNPNDTLEKPVILELIGDIAGKRVLGEISPHR